jgi:dihydrolipoamide dehydrogenase
MLVIGAGYIGLELSTVYAALGTRVTIVEMMPGIMPGADRDLVRVFEKRVGPWFEEILTETTVKAVEERTGALHVTLSGKELENPEREFDTVLVTVGRKPSIEGIGLEKTGVRTTDKGYVAVNVGRQTDDTNLYAVGDITGPPQLAHKASHEARVAVEHALGRNAAFDPYAIPAVEYTDPEIAWCGLTETQAEEEGRDVAVASFPWQASGRAATMGRSEGLTKVVIDPETERVLGVGIAGTNAGELIPEATLAIEMSATAEDVARTIHPHPTLSETFMEAAEAFYGLSTHIYRPKRR